MDDVLIEAERFLLSHQYQEAVELLRAAQPSENMEWQSERRRLLAWALLSTGETKDAYELFWSCAHHEGARAGILLLTVLAGQVETAILNWQRHCEKLVHPPLQLPDEAWHTPAVVRPALQILGRYPFKEKSSARGASAVYQALLYQSQNDAPGTFNALGQVTDFYPPACLLRDKWMDGLLCLPLPRTEHRKDEQDSPFSPSSAKIFIDKNPNDAVVTATNILLYPDIVSLERQCQAALDESRYLDALETLRRLLFLDPQHTPSLERRWRLLLKLDDPEAAKQDLYYLIDLYERKKQIIACQKAANTAIETFPEDERALLKMCFLQARLGAPTHLARHGRKLLDLCQRHGLSERHKSYKRWLLRQALSLDDRTDFEAS